MLAESVMVALFSIARASTCSSTVGVGLADTHAASRAIVADENFMMGRRGRENKSQYRLIKYDVWNSRTNCQTTLTSILDVINYPYIHNSLVLPYGVFRPFHNIE
ncbi:hypothetical protein F4803DRAFT_274783 [Xylaria telfairii]|nr:hypothetical protein F4803DRAFT_274783 [Xylaria telfairii]